jgi:hypothetical protein
VATGAAKEIGHQTAKRTCNYGGTVTKEAIGNPPDVKHFTLNRATISCHASRNALFIPASRANSNAKIQPRNDLLRIICISWRFERDRI